MEEYLRHIYGAAKCLAFVQETIKTTEMSIILNDLFFHSHFVPPNLFVVTDEMFALTSR